MRGQYERHPRPYAAIRRYGFRLGRLPESPAPPPTRDRPRSVDRDPSGRWPAGGARAHTGAGPGVSASPGSGTKPEPGGASDTRAPPS
jgi:hypothetical protein